MKSRYAPVALVFLACFGATVIAVIDGHYRDGFMQLANSVIVGFWGYMQQPKD